LPGSADDLVAAVLAANPNTAGEFKRDARHLPRIDSSMSLIFHSRCSVGNACRDAMG
jgi:hypothetical protein